MVIQQILSIFSDERNSTRLFRKVILNEAEPGGCTASVSFRPVVPQRPASAIERWRAELSGEDSGCASTQFRCWR